MYKEEIRGGLVFQTHILSYHSTLGSRVINNRRREDSRSSAERQTGTSAPLAESTKRSGWLRWPAGHNLSRCGEDMSPVPTANACIPILVNSDRLRVIDSGLVGWP